MAKTLLPDNLKEDIKDLGTGIFAGWLSENNFTLPKTENLFDSIEAALQDNTLQISDVLTGIAELEENSEKVIFLLQVKDSKAILSNQRQIFKFIKRNYGYIPTDDVTIRTTPGNGPTFIYMNVNEEEIKFKFSEKHFDKEDDLANDRYIRVPRIVNVYFIIEIKTGFAQIRFDSPAGQIHTHKNDANNVSESVFHNYYKDLFIKLFPSVAFEPLNLLGIANYIRLHETERFLMQKIQNTISEGAKQTYTMPRRNRDVRLVKELVGAAATDANNEWLTDDLSGFWLASQSGGQLKKDLFMRIYRRDSEIRVQRGCLKKELDYGISKIREIQGSL